MSTPLTAFRLTNGLPFGPENRSIEILDQLLLPHDVKWEKVETIVQAFDAIKSMKVSSLCLSRRRDDLITNPVYARSEEHQLSLV
jgi:hypothetical protein